MPSLHLSRIKITAPLCIIFPLFTWCVSIIFDAANIG
jgi:hypothetical protein